MKYSILTLFICSVLLVGCDKDDKGGLVLNFVGTYDGAPLVLGENLSYEASYDILLLESDFYISEIALTKGSEVIRIKDIDFVDFTSNNFSLENAMAGIKLNYADIPVGTYDGIRFGIGVPPTENGMLPSDFESSNPLSKTGYYWDAWDSYIFAKYAGKINIPDASGFFFHTGTDGLFRTLEISKEIIISDESVSTIKISLDHKKLMNQNGGLFNILDSPANHDPTALEPLEMIVNNYSTAFSYE